MQLNRVFLINLVGLSLLAILPVAVAHGHDADMTMEMSSPSRPTISSVTNLAMSSVNVEPASYFQHTKHTGLLFAHIFVMVLAWLFLLPIAVMLSIARRRSALALELYFLFMALNGVGVFLITIYNAKTPDLYPNNLHHKLGWMVTGVISFHVIVGVIITCAGRRRNVEQERLRPVSTEAMAEHQRLTSSYRFSNDSGQGTEPNTESLRSQSISSSSGEESAHNEIKYDEDAEIEERRNLYHHSKINHFLSLKVPRLLSSRALVILQAIYDIVDRLILMLGFVLILTGLVTYGGLFMGDRIFSGAAHFIKGGVFFWFGILTMGRWAGCFADIGWAWNINPSRSKKPSAEFVESFLLFFYGATNVFLEHLAAWGSAWTAQDLEHVSITLMFIGGGLCGMIVESKRVRNLLNVAAKLQPSYPTGEQDAEPPKSYQISMNPLPALMVMLVGLLMSSHHQDSMVSTMIHKQWGTLLACAALARGATYVVFYLKPPTSILPGRPPTELITAFCLMAGGMIFMASARDVVMSMELHDVDAMFVFTVAMGINMFLMAWILVVIAIKGWALRKENSNRFDYRYGGIA